MESDQVSNLQLEKIDSKLFEAPSDLPRISAREANRPSDENNTTKLDLNTHSTTIDYAEKTTKTSSDVMQIGKIVDEATESREHNSTIPEKNDNKLFPDEDDENMYMLKWKAPKSPNGGQVLAYHLQISTVSVT